MRDSSQRIVEKRRLVQGRVGDAGQIILCVVRIRRHVVVRVSQGDHAVGVVVAILCDLAVGIGNARSPPAIIISELDIRGGRSRIGDFRQAVAAVIRERSSLIESVDDGGAVSPGVVLELRQMILRVLDGSDQASGGVGQSGDVEARVLYGE